MARIVGDELGYSYYTFDDETARAAASSDPVGFVLDLADHVVLDEVQRVPEIFSAIKLVIDRDRTPGRFMLTGSTNVLLMPSLADSLAGRMETVRLHPLAQCELARTPSRFLERLLTNDFSTSTSARLGHELVERVVGGGYPAALARSVPSRRRAWYRSYAEAIVQRDVRDLAHISALDAIAGLLEVAASRTARLLNVSELAGPFQVSRPTIREYLTLLERLFLACELPAWHLSQLKRLVKTPKLHMGDTGLASALLSIDAESLAADRALFGPLLETFVYQELVRLASFRAEPVRFSHYRDRDGVEVDIVLEVGQKLAAVEVKAAATVTSKDLRGIRHVQAVTGERFVCGVILYDGETCVPFGERVWAVPIRALWDAAPNAADRNLT